MSDEWRPFVDQRDVFCRSPGSNADSPGRPSVDASGQAQAASNLGHPPQYATAIDADLIVMPSHGRTGLARMLIGSVTERVIRLARCPVLVIRK